MQTNTEDYKSQTCPDHIAKKEKVCNRNVHVKDAMGKHTYLLAKIHLRDTGKKATTKQRLAEGNSVLPIAKESRCSRVSLL